MQSLPGRGASTPGSQANLGPPRILAFSKGDRRGAGSFVAPRKILGDLATEIAATGGHRAASSVSVTLDVPDTLQLEADGEILRRLLTPLLDRSVAAAAGQIAAGSSSREVLVTAVGYPDRIEIEFADSGSGLTPWERNSLPRGRSTTAPRESTDPLLDDVLRLAASIGGTLSAIDCPEGGSAVTLSLPIRRAALRWAA
jgi:C4-dicarboxylate-specific signal transduction histidine kinase